MDTKKLFSERYVGKLLGDPEEIRKIDSTSQEIMNQVGSMVSGIKAKSVLDYGCGVGKAIDLLFRAFKPDKYIGMDIVPVVITANKKYFKKQKAVTFKVVKGEIKDKVDLVWTASTLQHMDDEAVAAILKNFAKILSKKGHLIVWSNTSNLPDLPYMRRRSINTHGHMLGEAGFDVVDKKSFPVSGEEITVFVAKKK